MELNIKTSRHISTKKQMRTQLCFTIFEKTSTKKQERTFHIYSCFAVFVFTCKAFSFANDKLFHPLCDPGSRSDFWRRWCESALHNFLLHVTNLINNTNICLFELSLLYTHKLQMQGLYTLYFLRTNNDGNIDAGGKVNPMRVRSAVLIVKQKTLVFWRKFWYNIGIYANQNEANLFMR